MIQAVIFDLDGVLVSTDEMHFLAWKKLADELGIHHFDEKDNIRQRGVSRMASLEIVLEKSEKQYSDKEKKYLADKKNAYYKKQLASLNPSAVLEGAKASLKALHKKGIFTAVGSASKNAPEILNNTGLIDYIDQVSCGLDTSKSKPDPEVFLVAAKKLGIAPERCVVIEDSKAGIVAAKRANMKAIAVGPHHETIGGDDHYSSVAEIDWNAIINLPEE